MRRRYLVVLAVPALVASLACGGLLEDSSELAHGLWSQLAGVPPTPLQQARAHCEAALGNARLYEDLPPIDPHAVTVCERWYGESASPEELAALGCMAGAPDQAAWDACRAPFAPSGDPARDDMYDLHLPVIQVGPKSRSDEIAENAGILGALRAGGELEEIFGSGALDSDLTGGVGGLIGAKGTLDGASGYGGSFGPPPTSLTVQTGAPLILGALERSLVDAVIQKHLGALRYCYQRRLLDQPQLAGKVVVKFVIAKDGAVSTAAIKSSTMNNQEVETCVAGRFRRMLFPQPEGGGVVVVTYPMIFAPGE